MKKYILRKTQADGSVYYYPYIEYAKKVFRIFTLKTTYCVGHHSENLTLERVGSWSIPLCFISEDEAKEALEKAIKHRDGYTTVKTERIEL